MAFEVYNANGVLNQAPEAVLAHRDAAGVALGNNAKTSSLAAVKTGFLKWADDRLNDYRTSEFAFKGKKEAFHLQDVLTPVLGSKSRQAACVKYLIDTKTHVDVRYSRARGSATFGNVQTCGSVWSCPHCSRRISEGRIDEIKTAVKYAGDHGLRVLFATRTFSHKANDQLSLLLKMMRGAEKSFKGGKLYQKLKEEIGIVGTIRAQEITFGNNGWHPHIHELIFISTNADIEDIRVVMSRKWVNACKNNGLVAGEKWGFDIREVLADDGAIQEYLCKLDQLNKNGGKQLKMKDRARELGGWVKKNGRNLSLSPFDLLRVASVWDGAKQDYNEAKDFILYAQGLFKEFAEAHRGARQLVWSKGLKALCGVGEVDDQELAEGKREDEVVVCSIGHVTWKKIVRWKDRYTILEYVQEVKGDSETVIKWLSSIGYPTCKPKDVTSFED